MVPSRSHNDVSDWTKEPDDAVALSGAVVVAQTPHGRVQGAMGSRRRGNLQWNYPIS
jgi:hypothetical protein